MESTALMRSRLVRLLAIFSLSVVALATNPPVSFAQDKEANGKTDIFIATRTNLPPYVENMAQSGIEIDLIDAIFESTQYRPIYVQQPRVRMISAFEGGHMDGILTQNIKASETGCATEIYIQHENVAKTLSKRDLKISGLDGLAGHSVVSFSGATRYIGETFRNAVAKAERYIETSDQGTHISLLYKNRFDVIVGDGWILQLAQKRLYEQTGEYQPLTTHSILKPSFYVARFQDKAICEAFNSSLNTLRESGGYAAIWNQYEQKLQFTELIQP